MNIGLNLATRPYIELRPVYARLRLAAIVLAALALPMLLLLHAEEAKARAAEARAAQLEENIILLRQQDARTRALAREGQNASVLAESAFLNDLFHRKAFSWTATMSDLEQTLPAGIQVQAIDPLVAPDGHVTVRMRVSGVRERAVEVVRNLEHSRHFGAPRLTGEALANQGPGGVGSNAQVRPVSATGGSANDVNFDILADYRPLPNSHDAAGLHAAAVKQQALAAAHTAAVNGGAQLTTPADAARLAPAKRSRHAGAGRAKPSALVPPAAATGVTR